MKAILLSLFCLIYSYGNIILKAPDSFIIGDRVVFTLQYNGVDTPNFPNIKKIEDFTVSSLGTTSNLSIINGKRSQHISHSYFFYPTRSVTIPSFKIQLNNKTIQTKPKTIKATQTKKHSLMILI